MKISALVVDDEPVARAGPRHLLSTIDWIEIVGEAASGSAAVALIDELRPELVFLDVLMPGLTGVDVLRALSHQPYVVFTTAYAEHAVTAFELGAVDYLLKPFGLRGWKRRWNEFVLVSENPAHTPRQSASVLQ